MNSKGVCMKCGCGWQEHRNMDHKNILEKEKKIVTVAEIYENYKSATKNADSEQTVINNVEQEEKRLSDEFQSTVKEIRFVCL